jgi:hemolysin activation/secretion protein
VKVVLGCVILGCLAGWAFSASAQTAQDIEQAVRQQQLEIRQEQDILRREKLQRELETDFQQLSPPAPEAPPVTPEGPCFPIQSIVFVGLDDLADRVVTRIQGLAQPYLDQCLSVAQLSELTRAINALFLDQGLVTTRVFLPEQSLKEGVLTLRILVGKVQELKSDTLTPRNLDWAFPVQEGASAGPGSRR